VTGQTSGVWTLLRHAGEWIIGAGTAEQSQAVVRVAADTVWRLLYNAPFDRGAVSIDGDPSLAEPLLETRSVIV
jgi:hypothetical protein